MIKIDVHDKQDHEVFKITKNIIKNLQRCTQNEKLKKCFF